MRAIILICLSALAVFFCGCNSHEMVGSQTPVYTAPTPKSPLAPDDDARRISVEEAHALWVSGKAVIVDVRGEIGYNQSHIKDALDIALMQLMSKVDTLPKDKTIIFYCTCVREHTSAAAVLQLRTRGMDNSAALVGGLDAWKKAGYPVDGANTGGN